METLSCIMEIAEIVVVTAFIFYVSRIDDQVEEIKKRLGEESK